MSYKPNSAKGDTVLKKDIPIVRNWGNMFDKSHNKPNRIFTCDPAHLTPKVKRGPCAWKSYAFTALPSLGSHPPTRHSKKTTPGNSTPGGKKRKCVGRTNLSPPDAKMRVMPTSSPEKVNTVLGGEVSEPTPKVVAVNEVAVPPTVPLGSSGLVGTDKSHTHTSHVDRCEEADEITSIPFSQETVSKTQYTGCDSSYLSVELTGSAQGEPDTVSPGKSSLCNRVQVEIHNDGKGEHTTPQKSSLSQMVELHQSLSVHFTPTARDRTVNTSKKEERPLTSVDILANSIFSPANSMLWDHQHHSLIGGGTA